MVKFVRGVMRRRWLPLLVVVAGWIGSTALLGAAGSGDLDKPFDVKAAFLLNFPKYVEWPPERFAGPASPIRIGVLGKDPFGDSIDKMLVGRLIGGRPVEVVRLTGEEKGIDVHVLFVAPGFAWRGHPIRKSLERQPVLIVGDSSRLLDEGGAVAFRIVDRTVKFEVDEPNVEQAGLKLGSVLLKAAFNVRRVSPATGAEAPR